MKRLAVIYHDQTADVGMVKLFAARIRTAHEEGPEADVETRLLWSHKFNPETAEKADAVIVQQGCRGEQRIIDWYSRCCPAASLHFMTADGDWCLSEEDTDARSCEGEAPSEEPVPARRAAEASAAEDIPSPAPECDT